MSDSLPASFLRRLEMLVEELESRVIGRQPGSMQEKVMNLVGKNQLLELHILFSQRLNEIDGFRERNVAVVVALDQQYGRAPRTDGRKRRGFPSEPCGIGPFGRLVRGRKSGNLGVPIVDTVHVDARGEQIGGAREAEGR